MEDLNLYFNPVSIERPIFEHMTGNAVFPHNITIHTDNNPVPELTDFSIAILGVPEGRNSHNTGSSKAPDSVRSQLFRLAKIPGKTRIIDLGNMKRGNSIQDTLAGLADIIIFLLKKDVFPMIIGGSSTLIPSIDVAFTRLKLHYTLTSVDSRIDYSNSKREPDSFNYLNSIIHNSQSTFNHYINIGYQVFLNDQQVINRFSKRRSEMMRIGDARRAIHLAEPLLRDSDAALFDISAVRQSDAPGTDSPSPNGFYGEEICLLSRYAGISDKMRIFGIFDINPDLDTRYQTSCLAAQILWFFLEGFSQKHYETPVLNNDISSRFIKYHVRVPDINDEMVFIKSEITNRWWMEIPSGKDDSIYVACSYDDYLKANRNEVPDRWVNTIERQKL